MKKLKCEKISRSCVCTPTKTVLRVFFHDLIERAAIRKVSLGYIEAVSEGIEESGCEGHSGFAAESEFVSHRSGDCKTGFGMLADCRRVCAMIQKHHI